MLNFNQSRFEKVISDALAMRPGIEKAVDAFLAQADKLEEGLR